MPAQAYVKIGQNFQTGPSANGEVPYVVTGATTKAEAIAAILDAADDEVDGGYVLDAVGATEAFDGSAGIEGLWDGFARYRNSDTTAVGVGGRSFNFSTAGGTQHVTVSKYTKHKYAAAGVTPPDFKRLINVTKNGADGVDIGAREFEWVETQIFSTTQLTPQFMRKFYIATDTVNTDVVNTRFGQMQPGELLFKYVDGAQKGPGQVELQFHVAASQNITADDQIKIGDIDITEKEGWDYLWVYYEETLDTNGLALVLKPVAAYVEEVYDRGELAPLGIW